MSIKVEGNYVSGDQVKVENFTKGWVQIEIDAYVFWKDSLRDEYTKATSDLAGLYTEVMFDRTVSVRFSDPYDAELFANRYLFNGQIIS